jgi:hypothetical protein
VALRHANRLFAGGLIVAFLLVLTWLQHGADSPPVSVALPTEGGASRGSPTDPIDLGSRIDVGPPPQSPRENAIADSQRSSSGLQLFFDVDLMPEAWALSFHDRALMLGAVRSTRIEPGYYPLIVKGLWHGFTVFEETVDRPGDRRIKVRMCREIEVIVHRLSEAQRWLCYSCVPTSGIRDFPFTVRPFPADGRMSWFVTEGETRQFVVWGDGSPPFTISTEQSSIHAAWTTEQIVTPSGVSSPIRGRVVDRQGIPVAGIEVDIKSLFPEAWGGGDFMILDAERARARGGFAAVVKTDERGAFDIKEVGPEAGQPFSVNIRGTQRRLVSPARMLHTTRGGSWVDVIVE